MSALRPMIARSVTQATRFQMRSKATTALQTRGQPTLQKGNLAAPMAMLTVGCGLTFVVGSKANDALKNPDSYVLFETSFFKTDEKEKQAEKYSKKMAEYYSHI